MKRDGELQNVREIFCTLEREGFLANYILDFVKRRAFGSFLIKRC